MVIWRVVCCVLAIVSVTRAEETTLRWRFQPGEKLDYRMMQTAKLDLTLAGGSKLVTKVERTFDFHWSVQSVDPNGMGTIAVQVTAVKLRVMGPGGQEAVYDSAGEEEPRGFAATLIPLFKALLNSELVARVSPRGALIDFEIPEDLETILRRKPAGKALGQLGSAADLESLLRLGLPELPDSDVTVGGQWEVERSVEVGTLGPLVAHTTYHWESTRDENGEQLARIVATTTIRFVEPKEGAPVISSEQQLSSGEILFNLTAGRLESSARNEGMDLSIDEGGEPATGILEHTLTFDRIKEAD